MAGPRPDDGHGRLGHRRTVPTRRRRRRHRGARRTCRGRRHRLGRSVSGPYPVGRRRRLGRPPSSRATRRRLVGLCAAFFVMFAAVVIRLADVQVVNPDRYVSQGVRQRFVSKQLPAGRGSRARPQRRRARAVAAPEVRLRRSRSWSRGPARPRDRGRARAAPEDGRGRPRGADHRRRAATCSWPTPSRTRWPTKIAELDLTGIGTFDEFKRYQPSGDVARSVLGRVSDDGTEGSSGLERAVRRAAGGPARQDHLRAAGHGGRR